MASGRCPGRERRPGHRPRPPRGRATATATRRTARAEQEARAGAERRAAAQAKLADAEQRHDDAAAAEREANDLTDRLTSEINELRERLELAQRDARLARQHRMAAERDVAAAQRRLDRTE